MYSFLATTEEWEVFKILCPDKFMEVIKKNDYTHDKYMTLILTLEKLGFLNIANDIYIRDYALKFEDDNINDEVLKKSDQYVKMFLDNIKSEGLKEIFTKKNKL